MLERGLWRLIFKLHEEDMNEMEEMFEWVRQTYSGELELHVGNSLYSTKVITFNPTKRKSISIHDNHKSNDFVRNVMIKRKEFSVVVDKPQVATFDNLSSSGVTLPWIGAILKQRATKEAAWVLGLKNAIVIGKADTFRGMSFYRIVCEEITEMIPKNLAPVPLKWRVPNLEVEPLF